MLSYRIEAGWTIKRYCITCYRDRCPPMLMHGPSSRLGDPPHLWGGETRAGEAAPPGVSEARDADQARRTPGRGTRCLYPVAVRPGTAPGPLFRPVCFGLPVSARLFRPAFYAPRARSLPQHPLSDETAPRPSGPAANVGFVRSEYINKARAGPYINSWRLCCERGRGCGGGGGGGGGRGPRRRPWRPCH